MNICCMCTIGLLFYQYKMLLYMLQKIKRNYVSVLLIISIIKNLSIELSCLSFCPSVLSVCLSGLLIVCDYLSVCIWHIIKGLLLSIRYNSPAKALSSSHTHIPFASFQASFMFTFYDTNNDMCSLTQTLKLDNHRQVNPFPWILSRPLIHTHTHPYFGKAK